MRQSTNSRDFSLIWADGTRMTDLDFADDVVLIDSDVKRLQELTTAAEQESSKVGLCVNSTKFRVSDGWEGRADIYATASIRGAGSRGRGGQQGHVPPQL